MRWKHPSSQLTNQATVLPECEVTILHWFQKMVHLLGKKTNYIDPDERDS
jgi:hypothetical protein